MSSDTPQYDGFQMRRLFVDDDSIPSGDARKQFDDQRAFGKDHRERYLQGLLSRQPEDIKQYKKWVSPTRMQRIIHWLKQDYVNINWVYQPSRWQRFTRFIRGLFTKKGKR